MDVRKTFFVLPNLFTLSSVFCGFFSITLSAGGTSTQELYQAALAICFGYFFDTFDGRVARLTRTQTQLGLQLDSLADVITFGVAPASLIYKWGLSGLPHPAGLILAFLFVAGAALRLARFNVLSQHEATPGKFILGLPVPAASAVLVALVILNVRIGRPHSAAHASIGALVVVLSYLMVSRVRFRSFKDLSLNRRSLAVTLLLAIASVAVALELRASFVFLFLISAYLGLGLAEELVFFRRRRAEERASAGGSPPLPEDTDEEVLRELGAFDGAEPPLPEGTSRPV